MQDVLADFMDGGWCFMDGYVCGVTYFMYAETTEQEGLRILCLDGTGMRCISEITTLEYPHNLL